MKKREIDINMQILLKKLLTDEEFLVIEEIVKSGGVFKE